MIPRQVHRVWLGAREPEWTIPFAASWRRPGWTLRQWSGPEELYPLRNQVVYDRADEIAPNHVGQLRADVLRLEILARYGGVYVDADFECLRPIDDLLDGVECFAAWEVPGRWVANGIMGCVPGHRFVERLIEGLAANVEAERGWKPNRMSGPQYVTAMYHRFGAGVRVFPRSFFYPYSYSEIAEHGPGEDFPGAFAAHHWFNKRRERNVPVAA